ncbi:AfsR/SARP family transcriptional regulator [Pseudonocardia acaciae]|uniref:AfsR/SARP family transcriptional regulator n=1 Tax=Pseudonocardia acaciae TaxID=551276 RepID=UPI000A70F1A8|nr:bacterial transcriptional activator domain-containing protein [Pseudonocardia acaciae]
MPVLRPRLRVLGSFELRIPLATGTGATTTATSPLENDERRVLALLALIAAPTAARDLARVLWPRLTGDVALGTLAGVCDSLGDLVVAQDGTLRLSGEVSVDLARALELLRAWEQAPSAVESHAPDELVELLSGDLLPGWAEDWVRPERERFRRVRLHALESLCRRLTAAGRHELAIRAGLLVVGAEPLREGARRALIEAHLAAGNVSEAVHQYELFVQTCAKLGLAPCAEFSAFFPPSPAWPVLRVRRPIHPGGAVGRGLRLDAPSRRTQVSAGTGVWG